MDENGYFPNSHSMLNRWKNYCCQLLIVSGINSVRETEVHTAEPLVPEPSSFRFDIFVEN
jgi:hypothetical protein